MCANDSGIRVCVCVPLTLFPLLLSPRLFSLPLLSPSLSPPLLSPSPLSHLQGFPSEGFEGAYRNHMKDVQRFFSSHHGGNYKLYNLCEERAYDAAKFEGRVSRYGFADHNPCQFDLIEKIMRDIHSHLCPEGKRDEKRVAAIHCKAGKGR